MSLEATLSNRDGAMNLYLGTDNLIRLTGLKDSRTSTLQGNATVTVTVAGPEGIVAQDLVLSPDGTAGDYSGNLPHTTQLTWGSVYTVSALVVVQTEDGEGRVTITRRFEAADYTGESASCACP